MDFTYLNTLADGYDREQVLQDLIHAYRNDVWDYAFSITRSADLADDIAQDVFLKVYEKLHTFRGEASIKNWVLRITRNISFNRMKSGFFRRVLLMGEMREAGVSAPSAEKQAMDRLQTSEAWQLVLELPVKHREVLVLHAHHELTQEEIAVMLHLPLGTVKSRLHHARTKLAGRYKGGSEHDEV
ncbi:RNA polymerase sigma factor [Paenibacillus sp. 1011MAR3C5]|uniref:RNA polymerase sigma factor n=1 Tax=Paenibacillus sp. 1011MAR3C5 TaxID=1675787 RepID=UPI000E6C4B4D|nr:RNA polymerase sigma factor [Paenibacillus sp. 1011MAR3C5]RJE85522.1 RNA polymerase sigma factor [Paenibacillus sp. 1011MAR3C5]